MSLINRMLKDLDARRAEAGGVNPFGSQVRAVPEQRGIHPAWWLALALGLALAGTVTWIVLRPAPVQIQTAHADLSLRLEGSVQAPTDAATATSDTTASPVDSAVSTDESVVPPIAEPDLPADVAESTTAVEGAVQEAMATPEPKAPAPAAVAEPKRVNDEKKLTAKPASVPVRESTKAPAPEQAQAPAALEALSREPLIAKQVRALSPQQQAENAFRKGVLALQQGRKAEALAGFEQALRLDSAHVTARQSLIAVLIEEGRTGEALNQARAGFELDRRQAGLAMILARLQMERDDVAGALETLESARAHTAVRADFLAFHAALLQRIGRHAEAAEQYIQALQQAPQNGVWWMGLGISLQADGRAAQAREAYQRAKDSNVLSPELVAFVDQRLAQLPGENR